MGRTDAARAADEGDVAAGAESADEAPGSEAPRALRRWLLPALVGLAALYAVTATWTTPYNVDAYTNALQARSFADGSVLVDGYDDYVDPPYQGELTWLVRSPDGTTSQYPPGTALWAAPFYLFDTSVEIEQASVASDISDEQLTFPVPSMVPAALAAVASVVVAMGFLGASLQQLVGDRFARGALAVAALGTGAWSIAADMLWQHGPAMMGISAGVYLASRERYALSGVGFAFAVLVRPHTAVIAAAVGLAIAIRRRRLRPAVVMGATSALGLAGVVLYNRMVFGEASISGGYGNSFADRFADTPMDVLAGRVVGVFLDGQVGIFIYSPILVLAFLGLWRARRDTPDWALGAAIGGALYLLVQIRANRISGGVGFFGYRYPLEALMAAAPMLVIAVRSWMGDDELRRRLVLIAAGASIAIHATGAIAVF